MHYFFRLYTYELKKILKRKIVWIALAVNIVLAAFTGCGNIFSSITVYRGQEYVSMNGLEYERYKKENKMKLSGKAIDDTLLKETKEAYQKIHTVSYGEEELGAGNSASHTMTEGRFDKDTNLEELKQQIELYKVIYNYVSDCVGNYEAIHTIYETELYQARHERLLGRWDELGLSGEEKEYWIKKENKIETPFIYQYAEGWERVISAVYSLCFMMGITIAVCLANVFSEENLRKTDQLILCSRYGKKHCYFAKVAAGVTLGIVSGGITFFVTSSITLMLYGAEGKDAIVQILFPSCSRNMTVWQVVIMFAVIYLIVCLLWSIITMFLSESTKNGVAVTGTMAGGLFIAMILEIPDSYRFLSQIWELVPVRLMAIWQLGDNRLVKFLGVYLNNFDFAAVLYLSSCVWLIFMGKRIYENYQVKGR